MFSENDTFKGAAFEQLKGVQVSGCFKKKRGARGIRVFRPSPDFGTCLFGALEIWVRQKYARRSRNTRLLYPSRCNLRLPGDGQNLDMSGIRAPPEEYVCFLKMLNLRVPLWGSLGGPTFRVHQNFARRSRNTSFSPTRRFQGWHAQVTQVARARKARSALEEN